MAREPFRSGLHDLQSQAHDLLDDALLDSEAESLQEVANQSAVTKEMTRAQILAAADSGRVAPRLLYVCDDLSMLKENSSARQLWENLAANLDELHIIVTAPLRQSKKIVERLSDNMWLYTTGHAQWWQLPFAVMSVAADQLNFTDGFRPDFIVSNNPFLGGFGAYRLAKKYNRPLQVHVNELFWLDTFIEAEAHSTWYRYIARYVLKRTNSIRTVTREAQEHIAATYSHTTDIAQLPRYYDLTQLVSKTIPDEQIRNPYIKYSFVILYVGALDHDSTFFRAIDAARHLLKSTSVLMVVVGAGPAKDEFMERAKILGVDQQVVFKPPTSDLSMYLHSAHVGIVTDTDEASDEYVVTAAAAGLPLIMSRTKLREDLFEDGVNAFLCEETDTLEMSQKLTKFLNAPALRTQFSSAMQALVKNRLHEDPVAFREAYMTSLMSVFNQKNSDTKTESGIIEGNDTPKTS